VSRPIFLFIAGRSATATLHKSHLPELGQYKVESRGKDKISSFEGKKVLLNQSEEKKRK